MSGKIARRRVFGPLLVTSSLVALGLSWTVAPDDPSLTPASVDAASCVAKVDPALRKTSSATTDVIIVGRSPSSVASAVTHVGGRVVSAEPIVGGVRASVSRSRLTSLACDSSIISISPNSTVKFQSTNYISQGRTASNFAVDSAGTPLWTQGDTGQGIGVAVIDTGISPMNDLAGRIVYGPDLSGEGRTIDSFGHGTVMGGIIAGNGTDSNNGYPYTGMAPGATLISVKVAGRNGATDVSTVLEAMHWVAAYKDQYNIRVLNISWGTRSTQSPLLDPIDYAVERLWGQGIVVVAAAGNSGPTSGSIIDPGDDPVVLTVGAYDENGTTSPLDDRMPLWSSQGPTAAGYNKPDIVAPGRTIVATRSFGSQIEADHPEALIAPSYIVGSGTSQATAVTSGAVALLLQERPNLTPDQVKFLLTSTARPMFGVSSNAQGAGRLNLNGTATMLPGPQTQQLTLATGLGSLDLARGGRHILNDCANSGLLTEVIGEVTADCQLWDPVLWTGSSWTGSSWTGSSWTGSSWTGSSWTGSSWTGGYWTGSSWTGSSWTGSSWTGSSWTGSSWTGSSWTSDSWTSAEWSGADPPNEFQTLWWGDRPPRQLHVPGEKSR